VVNFDLKVNKNKNWVALKDKKTNGLLRIIYNPYHRQPKTFIKGWILPGHEKYVKAIAIK